MGSDTPPVDRPDGESGARPVVEPHDANLIYETRIEYGGTEEVAVAVVEAIAEVRDRPVSELVSRIDDAVEPDALDRIVRPLPDGTPRTGRVTFPLRDSLVRLDGDGRLRIFDRGGSGGE